MSNNVLNSVMHLITVTLLGIISSCSVAYCFVHQSLCSAFGSVFKNTSKKNTFSQIISAESELSTWQHC